MSLKSSKKKPTKKCRHPFGECLGFMYDGLVAYFECYECGVSWTVDI